MISYILHVAALLASAWIEQVLSSLETHIHPKHKKGSVGSYKTA